MSKSMCGCGCSIISSLMKRLGRSACCSDLLSCSHTSEHLQRLATGCPPQHKNAKPLSSSDSLAKVQEVASWLLEMNQDLLSGGSGSRAAQQQRQRPGAAGAGNSTSGRTPQPQAEHMNRVLEEQEQEAQQQRREPGEEEEGGRERPREAEEEPWPSGGEPVEEGRRNEVNGAEKGAQWMWEQEQRRRRGRHREEDEENEEENNNSGREAQVGAGLRSEEDDDRPEDEEDGEEEMDQDSDEFEHSEESGREEEEEAEDEEEGEEGLQSPSLRASLSDLNDNTDQSSGRQHQSSPSVRKNKFLSDVEYWIVGIKRERLGLFLSKEEIQMRGDGEERGEGMQERTDPPHPHDVDTLVNALTEYDLQIFLSVSVSAVCESLSCHGESQYEEGRTVTGE
ncbi:hypothetical protein QQF64_001229 [Cirrhinus molitorella]|uniref:Uncharacterized protein n=1 Tax=Cirrhinus molitorella TaxID=172907 RepID=A0ABR3P0T9_9TELE